MGTNYDWRSNPCPTCGHSEEVKHIGKSSAGWCFALHVYPAEGINDLADWITRWNAGAIYDEYDRKISRDDMISTITARSMPDRGQETLAWYRENHAQPGPNGLARHKVERERALGYGSGCIGHGDGTWDLIIGEFS